MLRLGTRVVVVGVVGALLLAATATAAPANLIKDGGFESPVVPVGGFTVFSTGQKFSKWTVTGAPGSVGIVSGTFSQNGYTFPARSGAQWIDLTGLSQTATGVSQTVATTSGTSYTLTFSVGNASNPGGIFGTVSTVNVLVDGTLEMTAVNHKGMGTTTQAWKKFTLTFSAAGPATTISFINEDPSNDTQNGLDAVKLVPSA